MRRGALCGGRKVDDTVLGSWQGVVLPSGNKAKTLCTLNTRTQSQQQQIFL